jgi:hypothetical protein
MQSEPELCGVCIVRVVRQESGLMITLTERTDVHDTSTQHRHTMTDVAQALEAIRTFILDVARQVNDLRVTLVT